ncbi:Putative transposase (identified by ISEscan HMM) [Klebsiella pneumoniae]|nr:Putative transposase (identified by ISEscan HMM) [Klebsiella pneumoniae]
MALWHEGPHWCRCQECLTHSLVTTAANEHDLNQLGNLLHGEEQFVSADAGYQGAPQREELAEVDVDWLIAERPGKVKP